MFKSLMAGFSAQINLPLTLWEINLRRKNQPLLLLEQRLGWKHWT